MPAPPRNRIPALSAFALAAVLAFPAWAQVTITTRVPGIVEVPSGRTCGFEAAHGDGLRKAWYWSIDELDGGTFISSQGKPRIQYRAPMVFHAPMTFHIRATDPAGGGSGVFLLRVLPERADLSPRHLAALDVVLQPQSMGPRALVRGTGLPQAMPFAGVLPGAEGVAKRGRLELWLRGILSVKDDAPAMKNLQGAWLAWNEKEVTVMRAPSVHESLVLQGRLTPVMPFTPADRFPRVVIQALGVLPPGADPEVRIRMVALLSVEGGSPEPAPGTYLCGLEPDGTLSPLAGRSGPGREGPAEGPGSEVPFGSSAQLAMNRQGDILVVDPEANRILRVTQAGRVSILAGARPGSEPPEYGAWCRDGVGTDARFKELGMSALDPATGDLYVIDSGQMIRQVTRDGAVTTILGPLQPVYGETRTMPALPARMPEHHYFASLNGGMAFDDGILFVCEGDHGLLAFNPRDRFLYPVLLQEDGGGKGHHARFGPLAPFAPGLPLSSCAAFNRVSNVAVRDGVGLVEVLNKFKGNAKGLVAYRSGLVRFTLPPGAFSARVAGGGAAAAEPAAERKEATAAAAPAAP